VNSASLRLTMDTAATMIERSSHGADYA
jgi:hypothetical protein